MHENLITDQLVFSKIILLYRIASWFQNQTWMLWQFAFCVCLCLCVCVCVCVCVCCVCVHDDKRREKIIFGAKD